MWRVIEGGGGGFPPPPGGWVLRPLWFLPFFETRGLVWCFLVGGGVGGGGGVLTSPRGA